MYFFHIFIIYKKRHFNVTLKYIYFIFNEMLNNEKYEV